MTDNEIIGLYWERSENALSESRRSYGRLCGRVAENILGSREDAEECFNDALFAAWNAIPPERPDSLSAYLAGITRNQALTRLKARRRQKRGGGEAEILLSELEDCVPVGGFEDALIDAQLIGETISSFLKEQTEVNAAVFTERYFYCKTIAEISRASGFTKSKITAILFRMREKLRLALTEKGVDI